MASACPFSPMCRISTGLLMPSGSDAEVGTAEISHMSISFSLRGKSRKHDQGLCVAKKPAAFTCVSPECSENDSRSAQDLAWFASAVSCGCDVCV